MKLPNGYGSVHKLSGRRGKPWRARLSAGFVWDEENDSFQEVFHYSVDKYKKIMTKKS